MQHFYSATFKFVEFKIFMANKFRSTPSNISQHHPKSFHSKVKYVRHVEFNNLNVVEWKVCIRFPGALFYVIFKKIDERRQNPLKIHKNLCGPVIYICPQEAWEGICQRKFPIELQVAVLQRVSTMSLKSKQNIIRETF